MRRSDPNPSFLMEKVVRLLVGERELRVRAKGKWLESSVQALAQRCVKDQLVYVWRDGDLDSRTVLEVDDEPLVVTAGVVVVAALSESYRPLYELWKQRLPDVEVMVAALECETRAELWVRRLEAVKEVLERGVPVVVSDVDAFWLSDPRPFLGGTSDFLFSIDHGLGRGDKNFALCCGFYRVLPTRRAKRVLAEWIRVTREVGDDQVAANRLFDAGRLEAATLPYDQFARCHSGHPIPDVPVVWHPWLDADVATKCRVWSFVLQDEATMRKVLREFYKAKRSVSLHAAELRKIIMP